MTGTVDECESTVHEFIRCLNQNKAERSLCLAIERVLAVCNENVSVMKGAPPNTTYCADEISDYAKCSTNPNTSMCANEYKLLHDCKLRRRRFLYGEDLGLVNMHPQARKRW
jgi:hypothetical protein